jgi:hypothetical protein
MVQLPLSGTLLVITPLSSPNSFQLQPYSGRFAKQTIDEIEPVGGSNTIVTTGNGGELVLVRQQFQKLKSAIVLNDVRPPALNASWRGAQVQVDCCQYRSYPAGGVPDRPIVPGTSPILQNGFFYFFPRLIMIVVNVTGPIYDEWKHKFNTTIQLRELIVPTFAAINIARTNPPQARTVTFSV